MLSTQPLWTRFCGVHSRGVGQTTVRCANRLPPPNLKKLAELARLGVTEAELRDWQPKVEEIVAWFDQLQGIDLSDVPPQLRATQNALPLRPDAVATYPEVEALMRQNAFCMGTMLRALSLWVNRALSELPFGSTALRPALLGLTPDAPCEPEAPRISLWLAAPKKRVSLHKRKQRWLNKWLTPVRQIAVCHYCGRALLPHQVLPCCLAYRDWHAAGNEGIPPELRRLGCRKRKERREKARRERLKVQKDKKRFVYPQDALDKEAPV